MSHSLFLRPLRLLAAGLVALFALALLGSVASAQTTPYGGVPTTPPTIGGTTTVPTTAPPSRPTSPTVLANTTTRFAVTGGDMVGLVAIGGGAVAVGTALVLAARRRRSLELV